MPNPNTQPKEGNSIIAQVAERVRTSDNVLVALSKDPSVDELSAALGLTFILDKMGKHATAIFSGAVPNAIEFLEPEKTFETNTNSLQDFIIALDKEKADHLRYKIDGDYVKVFITPYKTTIDEGDMEFSHGDYNVDLVIALNVASSDDLDSALTEYGRIMHDASSINISASVPGKFGDLEWGDPTASSVSEMVYKLSRDIKEKDKDNIDKPTATALLAGIVAATNRFSNEHTSPETMEVASKLMMAGADQQLISSSIPVDILTTGVVDATDDAKEEPQSKETPDQKEPEPVPEEPTEPVDPTNLEITHDEPKADTGDSSDASSNDSTDQNPQPEPESPARPDEAQVAEPQSPAEESSERLESQSPAEETVEQPEPESPAQPDETPVPESQLPAEEAPEQPESEPEPAPKVELPPLDLASDKAQEVPSVEVEPAPIEAKAPDLMPLSPADTLAPEPELAPAPESAPKPAPAPTPGPEPEPAEGPVEPPIIPIAPAEPEDLNELSVPTTPSVLDEQSAATAELEQLVNSSNAVAQDSTLSELKDASVHAKKNLTPPSEALTPPAVPKDYAAMMESELAEDTSTPVTSRPAEETEPLVAPVPDDMPVMDTSPEPVEPPAPAPEAPSAEPAPATDEGEAVNNEYVDPLPMPDPNTILPPPPAPFDPSAAPESADMAPLPSAQEYVSQFQEPVATPEATNSAASEPMNSDASMPPITAQVAGDNADQDNAPRAGVMPDQVYPADPGAFHIPGM